MPQSSAPVEVAEFVYCLSWWYQVHLWSTEGYWTLCVMKVIEFFNVILWYNFNNKSKNNKYYQKWGLFPLGLCLSGVMSKGRNVQWCYAWVGFRPVGFCPVKFCPVVFCLSVVLSSGVMSCGVMSEWCFVQWCFVQWGYVWVVFCPVELCLSKVVSCAVMSEMGFVLWDYVWVGFCPVELCLSRVVSCGLCLSGVFSIYHFGSPLLLKLSPFLL